MYATSKTRIVRPTSSTTCLDDGEVLHVGIVSREPTDHVVLLMDRRGGLATGVQPADRELLAATLKPFRDRVADEETAKPECDGIGTSRDGAEVPLVFAEELAPKGRSKAAHPQEEAELPGSLQDDLPEEDMAD